MNYIDYKPDMGEITLTDEMIATLKALPLEEQQKCFMLEYRETKTWYSYGERDGGKDETSVIEVANFYRALDWIVKDGIIVGISFRDWAGKVAYRSLDQWCCTYSVSDDDGTGSTDVDDYARLVWKK